MAPTTVSQFITITDSKGSASYAKGRELNLDGKDKGVSKNNIELFKILRAGDGDETNLSLEDFQSLAKNDAMLKSFGYEISKNGKNSYTVKGEKETFNFKFESLLEACNRKIKEHDIKMAAKELPNLQKKYADKYDLEFDQETGTYTVDFKQELSIGTVARDLSLGELEIAKALKGTLELSSIIVPESCLYQEEYAESLKQMKGTISNCEKGHQASYANLSAYTIPEGFTLTIKK